MRARLPAWGLGAILLLGLPAPASAQAVPVVREIAFEGNDTTQERTMLREMSIKVGEPADPRVIERSRQAIQDLGLFRSVEITQQAAVDGVRLVVTVREKYYVIPAPRVDTNSDGQYAYGLQLRWYNAFGLNHTAKATLKYQNRQQAGRGTALDFDASYGAPFLFDSPYGLELSVSRSAEPVEAALPYDEIHLGARAVVSRKIANGHAASQGWRVGTGLQWQDQATRGEGAPAASGMATALVLNGGYSDVRFNLYSEEGQRVSMEAQSTLDNASSDYDYTSVIADYDGSWYVGAAPHQSLALFAEAGAYHGGPDGGAQPYQLGGSGDLRGYRHNFLDGDTYYYAGAEFLRPVGWDWLRGVAFFEAGNTFDGDSNASLEHSYADVGLGLRLRATWFVRFELNVGVALPLVDAGDGTGARIFATGRR